MPRAQHYVFDLSPGLFLAVSQHGDQTTLALQSGAAGQQQSQQSSFQTGQWLSEPQAWLAHGLVHLRVQCQGGTLWFHVGRGQIGTGSPPPQGAIPVPSRALSGAPRSQTTPAAPPMTPMPPMPSMAPMEMRMGDMAMRMGSTPEAAPAQNPDLAAENLRLREENLRLREEVMALREQLWSQQRGG